MQRSVQNVGILIALLDQMAVDADPPRLQAALATFTGNLAKQIAFNVRFYAGGQDLIEIARTVSGTEPDLAAMWREGERRRYEAQRKLMVKARIAVFHCVYRRLSFVFQQAVNSNLRNDIGSPWWPGPLAVALALREPVPAGGMVMRSQKASIFDLRHNII